MEDEQAFYWTALPKYTLNEEQERKEILRQYRALLRDLRNKLKQGDKDWYVLHLEMAAGHTDNAPQSGETIHSSPIGRGNFCVEEIGLV